MNTNTKGRISELIAFAKFIQLGYVVSQPVNKDGLYDCVIEEGGKFKRIQIKTTRFRNNKIVIPMRSIGHNRKRNIIKTYTSEDVDYICGVCVELNKVFLIPVGLRNSEINLDIDSTEYLI